MISGVRPGSAMRSETDALPSRLPHIGKAHLDFAGWPVEQRLPRLIGAGHKLFHDVLRVLDGVVRLDHLGALRMALRFFHSASCS